MRVSSNRCGAFLLALGEAFLAVEAPAHFVEVRRYARRFLLIESGVPQNIVLIIVLTLVTSLSDLIHQNEVLQF